MVIGNRQHLVRFSFVQVWEPRAVDDNADPKFSCQINVPKDATELVEQVKRAVEAAKRQGIQRGIFNEAATRSSAFRLPLRDGDLEAEEKDDGSRDYLKGYYFFNAFARASNQPSVLDRFGRPIMRRDDFYSGCFGVVDVNFYPFRFGKGGVAVGLNSIMKREDGPHLDGRRSPEQAFGDLIDQDEASDADVLL